MRPPRYGCMLAVPHPWPLALTPLRPVQLPVIRGLIDRRILVNYRVSPEALWRVLPEPFRPQLVGGVGMAGICLIRLTQLRPQFVSRFLPQFVPPLGLGSENAAHRIAVEWDHEGQRREGVYIPRRDTSSQLNRLVGGRLFPGFHHHAHFRVCERDGRYQIVLDSDDGLTHLAIDARTADRMPARIGVWIAGRSIGIFRTRRTRLFRDADARRLRRIGIAKPELVGRAASDHARRIELFRRPPALPARHGRIRLGPSDAPHRTPMARSRADQLRLHDINQIPTSIPCPPLV